MVHRNVRPVNIVSIIHVIHTQNALKTKLIRIHACATRTFAIIKMDCFVMAALANTNIPVSTNSQHHLIREHVCAVTTIVPKENIVKWI